MRLPTYARFSLPKPKMIAERTLKGAVLKVDKFGNLITNLTPENAPALFAAGREDQESRWDRRRFRGLRNAYAEGQAGRTFRMLNSMGFRGDCVQSRGGIAFGKGGAGSGSGGGVLRAEIQLLVEILLEDDGIIVIGIV